MGRIEEDGLDDQKGSGPEATAVAISTNPGAEYVPPNNAEDLTTKSSRGDAVDKRKVVSVKKVDTMKKVSLSDYEERTRAKWRRIIVSTLILLVVVVVIGGFFIGKMVKGRNKDDMVAMTNDESSSSSSTPSRPAPAPSTTAFIETDLVETMVKEGNVKTFVDLIVQVGLTTTLTSYGDDEEDDGSTGFTIFAPTDTAFDQLDVTSVTNEHLEKLIKYHIVPGVIATSKDTIKNRNNGLLTTMDGQFIRLVHQNDNDAFTIQGADIIKENILASNGFLNVIEKVLIPSDLTIGVITTPVQPAPAMSPIGGDSGSGSFRGTSLVDVIAGTGRNSILGLALAQAGLTSLFADMNRTFTVFAPSDAGVLAIQASQPELAGNLLDPSWGAHVNNLFVNHAIYGELLLSTDLESKTYTMLSGEEVSIDATALSITDGVGQSINIIQEDGLFDIVADNGIAHVVDGVILPAWVERDIVQTMEEMGTFGTFLALATQVGILDMLSTFGGEGTGLTLFLPTDTAFESIDITALSDDDVQELIKYHVVNGVVDASSLRSSASLSMITLNGNEIQTEAITNGLTDFHVHVNNANIDDFNFLARNGIIHVIDEVLLPLDVATDPVSNSSPSPTLTSIQQAGLLKCGVPIERVGFAITDVTSNRMEGFDADLCRAVAAAIFGTSEGRVQFIPVTAFERFSRLEAGEIDMLARMTTHTMQRQVYEPTTKKGFDFSIPYLYEGLQFAGKPPYVQCADNATAVGVCADTKICVLDGTTHQFEISSQNPNLAILATPGSQDLYAHFIDDLCNVIAGPSFDIAPSILRDLGYVGEYELGALVHSKEPVSLVTRNDDRRWSDFVNWVMTALIAAEDVGVSQRTASILGRTEAFGPEFREMFIDAVKDVGNYGELYRRHLHPILPRLTPNRINMGDTGLLYSFPFGSLFEIGNMPVPMGALGSILTRDRLKCGVQRRAIFAEFDQITQTWSGFDVDFCRAIASAIFNGDAEKADFVNLYSTEQFERLQDGSVDILLGVTANLEHDVLERTTGMGFSFSLPIFYDGLTFAGRSPFATCADDLDVTSSTCRDVLICVTQGTAHERRLETLFPQRFIVSKNSIELAVAGLVSGECNVIAGGSGAVSRSVVDDAGFVGQFQVGQYRYSKNPLAIATREDDKQFSAFVWWIVSIIIFAEEVGIRQDRADELPIVNLFGPSFITMFSNAISAAGNYAEIYERNAEDDIPRAELNLVNWFLSGPMHYPFPGVV